MLAPFGGKWRISAERGHEIHVSIKFKNISLKKFIRHNYLFIRRLAYCKMFINRTLLRIIHKKSFTAENAEFTEKT